MLRRVVLTIETSIAPPASALGPDLHLSSVEAAGPHDRYLSNTGFFYGALANHKLDIFLPHPPKCSAYRCVSPGMAHLSSLAF